MANTNSAVNEFNSALEASLSVQNDLTKRMSDLNQTMKAFNGDLESTKTRVSIIEEQVNCVLTFLPCVCKSADFENIFYD